MTENPTEDLILRAQRGDREAIEILLTENLDDLDHYVRGVGTHIVARGEEICHRPVAGDGIGQLFDWNRNAHARTVPASAGPSPTGEVLAVPADGSGARPPMITTEPLFMQSPVATSILDLMGQRVARNEAYRSLIDPDAATPSSVQLGTQSVVVLSARRSA